MTISVVDQQAVWALDASLLGDNAKVVFQSMADYDVTYGPDAAALISTQLGGSLDESETAAALNELWEKGFLEVQAFVPRYPPVVPGPISVGGP